MPSSLLSSFSEQFSQKPYDSLFSLSFPGSKRACGGATEGLGSLGESTCAMEMNHMQGDSLWREKDKREEKTTLRIMGAMFPAVGEEIYKYVKGEKVKKREVAWMY